MPENQSPLNSRNTLADWRTINEAVKIANRLENVKITSSDIFRHALCGTICLSIYFQSPITLRKIRTAGYKIKLKPIENRLISRLCMLDKRSFLEGRNLILSTDGEYFSPSKIIIDTVLSGHEYIIIQNLLAHALKIPPPIIGARYSNYGISLSLSEDIFQAFEKITWQERIKKQIIQLPDDISADIYKKITLKNMDEYSYKDYFPIHDLPKDACFVIRHNELDKLIDISIKKNTIIVFNSNFHAFISYVLACLQT